MALDFSAGDFARVFDLATSDTLDIVVIECDTEGFILKATHGLSGLGCPSPAFLVPPRLEDLVAPPDVPRIRAEFALAAGGQEDRGWVEFRLQQPGLEGRWFALRLSPVCGPDGAKARAGRVLGVMRDVHERRMLEERLFAARLTDPLTALTNRVAFDCMLEHAVENRQSGWLALFSIGQMRAINHHLGHQAGDAVLKGFGDVLRTVMRTGDTLSRVADATFAVLILDATHADACRLVERAQQLFAGDLECRTTTLSLFANAGLAEIGNNMRDTLRRAELDIVRSKAGANASRRCGQGASQRTPRLPTRAAPASARRAG